MSTDVVICRGLTFAHPEGVYLKVDPVNARVYEISCGPTFTLPESLALVECLKKANEYLPRMKKFHPFMVVNTDRREVSVVTLMLSPSTIKDNIDGMIENLRNVCNYGTRTSKSWNFDTDELIIVNKELCLEYIHCRSARTFVPNMSRILQEFAWSLINK